MTRSKSDIRIITTTVVHALDLKGNSVVVFGENVLLDIIPHAGRL